MARLFDGARVFACARVCMQCVFIEIRFTANPCVIDNVYVDAARGGGRTHSVYSLGARQRMGVSEHTDSLSLFDSRTNGKQCVERLHTNST